jgi:hypothetical protein
VKAVQLLIEPKTKNVTQTPNINSPLQKLVKTKYRALFVHEIEIFTEFFIDATQKLIHFFLYILIAR